MRLSLERLEGRETPAKLGSLTVADSIPMPPTEWTPADFPGTVIPVRTIGHVKWSTAAAVADTVRQAPVAVREAMRAAGSGLTITEKPLGESWPVLMGGFFAEGIVGFEGAEGRDAAVSKDAFETTALHEMAHTFDALRGLPSAAPDWKKTFAEHPLVGHYADPGEGFAEYSSRMWLGWDVPAPVRLHLETVYV